MMPAALAPTFIFEDQHLVVLSKPAGLLSQGAQSGDENLVDWLREYFGRNYVGLIHRLDRNTSGLMVVAKRSKAAARLSDALRTGSLKRSYQGWLSGALTAQTKWINYLLKQEDENLVNVVPESTPNARMAELTAEPLERWAGPDGACRTLARFELNTGRGHQIRVQAAAHSLPLIGDQKYGNASKEIDRPALHSSAIEFPHPMTKEILRFTDEIPADMQTLRPTQRKGWQKLA